MPTIALVDDDRNILTSLRMVLEAEGYKTQTYNDGASALDGLFDSPPDLAILDIKMPRMDGMEVLRRLRRRSLAALRREESRGGHFRTDFPQRDDLHWKIHIAQLGG